MIRDLKPRYPDILRQAGYEGEVLLRYVIDTNGRAMQDSINIVRSTHALFTTAVRNALPLLSVSPPLRAGTAVKVVVEELVTFTHPGLAGPAVRPAELSRRMVDSLGRLLTTVYAFFPRDSLNAPVLTRSDSLEIFDVVVEELLRMEDPKNPPSAWCVRVDQRLTVNMLERWSRAGRRVVNVADCPRTYDSMFSVESAPKRPAGWIDPVQIGVGVIVSWAEDSVVLTAATHQGTSGRIIRCEVGRVAGKWTDVFCVTTHHTVS